MNDNNDKIIELAKYAIAGDSESLSRLCELSEGRVYAYIYRIVLCSDISHDIKQETMLEMCKSITELREAEKFWPWIRKIAYNCICNHYRRQKVRKTASLSAINGEEWIADEVHKFKSGFGNSISIELEKLIFSAVSELKARHRAIITMRCYEDAEYSEIAKTMGLSNVGVRLLFSRAKKCLEKRLIKKGFKKEFLFSAVVLFGKMTAESEAAAAGLAVPATALNVSTAVGILTSLASKASIVMLAGVMVLMGLFWKTDLKKNVVIKSYKILTSVGEKAVDVFGTTEVPTAVYVSQRWFYYPENCEGVTLRKVIKNNTLCKYLNEGSGNYYPGDNGIIYIKNANLYNSDYSVLTLPNDDAEMKEFICKVQGKEDKNIYISNKLNGSLVIVRSDDVGNEIRVIENKNLLEEEFYKYDMGGYKVVDQRDAAHKRGWTYFEISGKVGDKKINGKGRVPFVYDQFEGHWPLVEFEFEGGERFVDTGFGFLGRSWGGMHAIDVIRRDAGVRGMRFDTKILPAYEKAEISVFGEYGDFVYTVDLANDIIERVDFIINRLNDTKEKGSIEFNYLQDISEFEKSGAAFLTDKGTASAEGISWIEWLVGQR